MRIAFISYEYPPDTGKGGIGTYTKQAAEMLQGFGSSVHVFAGTHDESKTSIEKNVNIHRILCNDPKDFQIKVLNVFEDQHALNCFEIIESPEIHGNALLIKKKYPAIPLVIRLHAPNYLVESLKKRYTPFPAKLRFSIGALKKGKWDPGYWRKYDYLQDPDFTFCQLADALVSPSEIMKSWVVKNWRIDPALIHVVPNPFNVPETLLQLSIHGNNLSKEVIFFGRLNVLKGLVNATHAMKKVLKENPAYSFTVIGDDGAGPYPGIQMREWMISQLKGFREKLQFFDSVPYEELPAMIKNADIALLPALFESFSYTCAEAMAAGKAVVGSKKSGMADMIRHKVSGILVDAENSNEIYEAISVLIHDNEFRYKIAVNARDTIAEKFNSAKLAEIYISFYKTILNSLGN